MKPLTVDVVVAARLFGVGREGAYRAAKRRELLEGVPVLKVGGRYRVTVAALEAVLGVDLTEYLPAEAEHSEEGGEGDDADLDEQDP